MKMREIKPDWVLVLVIVAICILLYSLVALALYGATPYVILSIFIIVSIFLICVSVLSREVDK